MLQKTKGIVLRSIKYGETSLITTVFTEHFGVQSYLVQGVRKAGKNNAALLQPTTLLELITYHNPQKNLQRLKEYHTACKQSGTEENIVRHCIALFSVELVSRLLPEHAPLPDLFHFCFDYFNHLQQQEGIALANAPLYFLVHLSRLLGFELKGEFCETTPYLNLEEGGFSNCLPRVDNNISLDEARLLDEINTLESPENLDNIKLNATTRYRLIDWYLEFLYTHSQHLGNMKSLPVLRSILH